MRNNAGVIIILVQIKTWRRWNRSRQKSQIEAKSENVGKNMDVKGVMESYRASKEELKTRVAAPVKCL